MDKGKMLQADEEVYFEALGNSCESVFVKGVPCDFEEEFKRLYKEKNGVAYVEAEKAGIEKQIDSMFDLTTKNF